MPTHSPSHPALFCASWSHAPNVPDPRCLTITAPPDSDVPPEAQLWSICPLQRHLQFPQHQPVHLLGCQTGQHLSEAWILGTEQGAVGNSERPKHMTTLAGPSLTWAEVLAWSSRSSCPSRRIWSLTGTWAGPATALHVDVSKRLCPLRLLQCFPPPLTGIHGFQQPPEEQQKMQGILCVTEGEHGYGPCTLLLGAFQSQGGTEGLWRRGDGDSPSENPFLTPPRPLDREAADPHMPGPGAPLTCSQGPVPDQRPPDFPQGVSGCNKCHMHLFCPKEPQRQPRHCPPHPTDLEQRDKACTQYT